MRMPLTARSRPVVAVVPSLNIDPLALGALDALALVDERKWLVAELKDRLRDD